jgi:hypothetical protein
MKGEKMEKLVCDGKVAVLYSPGFGAGWYSWSGNKKINGKNTEALLFHRPFVELVLQGERGGKLEQAITDYFGEDHNIYLGGARDLKVKWLDEGTLFLIKEYDGSESIAIRDDQTWIKA